MQDTELRILAFLGEHYSLDLPLECHLVRSYTNDVYRIHSGTARFILKIYGSQWRTHSEVAYEMALLAHLIEKGLPAARPIVPAVRDAGVIREMVFGEEIRLAVLFEYAPGAKPNAPFHARLYEAFGRAIGRVHLLSDDFASVYPRRRLDLEYLVDASLSVVLPHMPETGDRAFVQDLAVQLKRKFGTFASTLDWGPVHGDASLDNLHVTDKGEIILYDFDSGGPGWRAGDLQGWAMSPVPSHQKILAAFREGYSNVRPQQAADWRAAPYLTLAWDLWGIRVNLERRVLDQGELQTRSFLCEQVARLREHRESLILI